MSHLRANFVADLARDFGSVVTLTQTEPGSGGLVSAGGIYRLLMVFSADPGEEGSSRTLRPDEPLVIGREPGEAHCMVLKQARASRRHAQVYFSRESGGFRICDLESRNGTFVNGRRIDDAELHAGDVVRIGQGLLLVQFLDLEACSLLLDPQRELTGRMVGSGPSMARVRLAIERAPKAVPTLILGETGVGKELVARAIHEHSGRRGQFVAVNCSAIPDSLVESELFGHVRGAFTGADSRRGLFGRADRGTLFLDEIGELGLEVQAKLLRALALGEVRPVGSDESRQVDVRVLSATNVDLEAAVAEGRFRPDLYARLMAHIIRVPALRDRKEDLFELVQFFLRGRGRVGLAPDSAEALFAYRWPYNVRELEQVLAAVAPRLEERSRVELDDLPERIRDVLQGRFEPAPADERIPISLLEVRRSGTPSADELREAFRAFGGNVAKVAAFFGKDRRQIYRWAETFQLDLATLRGARSRPARSRIR